MIYIGIVLGALVWVLESLLHVSFSHEGSSIISEIFSPSPRDLWSRSLMFLVFVALGISAHITVAERKRGKKALQHSEDKYRTIFENSGTAIMILHENMQIMLVNAQFETLSGYSKDEIERKKSFWEFVDRSDVEKIEKNHRLRQTDPNLAPRNYEFRFVSKRSDIRDILMTIAVVPGTSDCIASLLDITELKWAEKMFRQTASELQTIFQVLPDLYFRLDSSGIFQDLKVGCESDLYYSSDALIGKRIQDVSSPVIRVQFEKAIDKVQESKSLSIIEYSLPLKNGKQFFEARLVPLLDNQIIVIVRNISERKRVEMTLKYRLELERAVSQVASMLASREKIDLNEVIAILGPAINANWAGVVYFKDGKIDETFEWFASGVELNKSIFQSLNLAEYNWGTSRLKRNESVVINDVSELPQDASNEQKLLEQYAVQSLLLMPICPNGKLLGLLGFADSRRKRRWSEEDIQQLHVVTEIMGVYNQRRRMEEALKESEHRYRTLIENQGEGIAIVDIEEGFAFGNPAAHEIFGLPPGGLIGRSFNEFTDDKNFALVRKQTELRQTGKKTNYELEIMRPDGEMRTLLVTATPRHNNVGQFVGAFTIFRDITEKKRTEAEIRYLSYHDKLTGLFNRAYFEEELKRLDAETCLPLSVVMGDINGLKLVNDAFGHQEGDQLLKKAADILRVSCRKQDVVARWGGDEFAIVLPETAERKAMMICERIRKACGEADPSPIQPSIALGVATKEELGREVEGVLKEAESRMYRNKLVESKSARSSIISSLQKTLGERTHETEEHARRLKDLALYMGRALRLSDSQLDDLALLAVLHDIGKIAIPDSILLKPSSLSPEEWEIMKKHPEIGYRIAQSSYELAQIAEDILAHHERWDGAGYPQGLKGHRIPLNSRIVSVIDAYDAITFGRPYKKAVSPQEAIDELERCAGTQFDPDLVAVFAKMMPGLREAKSEAAVARESP